MNTMNKIFTLLAALLLSAPAFAADGDVKKTTVDGIEWIYIILSEEEKTCQIGNTETDSNGYPLPAIDTSTSGTLSIPSNLDGYTVVSIGRAAFHSSAITSAVIPETVTEIGNLAFRDCKNLVSVNIPKNVASLGVETFGWCEKLETITIPAAVTVMDVTTFDGCSGLTSITVEEGNTVFDSRENCNAIIRTQTNLLYQGCKNTTIPQSVTAIGMHAFYGCNTLTSITIPKGINSIGTYVFHGCSGLESMVVEDGNAYFDSRDNCNAIISKSDNTLLYGCKNTVIPSSVTSIGSAAFAYNEKLESIHLPEGLTTISAYAFQGCSSLKSIQFPESLRTIGGASFNNCSSLTSVEFPAGITTIGNRAFYNCSGLISIISHITEPFTIASGTFLNQTDEYTAYHTSATLYVPAGCKEKYATTNYWKYFTTIKEIGVEEALAALEQELMAVENELYNIYNLLRGKATEQEAPHLYSQYEECLKMTDYIHANIQGSAPTTMAEVENYKAMLTDVMAKMDNLYRAIRDYVPIKVITTTSAEGIEITFKILSDDDKTLQVGTGYDEAPAIKTSRTGTLTIPSTVDGYTVVAIGKDAFYDCSITSVVIPETVTTIDKAFTYCRNLATLNIPASVTSLAENFISGFRTLTSLTVAEGNTVYDSRNNCNAIIETAQNKLVLACNATVVPEGIKEVGSYAFGYCKELDVVEFVNAGMTFNNNAFINSSIKSIILTNANKLAFQTGAFNSSVVEGLYLTQADGTLKMECNGNMWRNDASPVYKSIDTEYVIPETITAGDKTYTVAALGNNAFTQCANLTKLTIPATIKAIEGTTAFKGCTALRTIISNIAEPFAFNAESFETDVYSQATLSVPAGTKALYQTADGWKNFVNIVSVVLVNEENFPDETFRELIASADIDKDQDGNLSEEEIAAVKKIGLYNKPVYDLKGVEFFTALTVLEVGWTHIKSLDLSCNTALKELNAVGAEELESLDISKNTALEFLNLHDTNLSALDVSHLKGLRYLYCTNLGLEALDISQNTALRHLYCEGNQLTTLDVSKHRALTNLACADNKLTSLEISNNPELVYLMIDNNQITSLDISNNVKLQALEIRNNKVGDIDVSKHTELNRFYCDNCGLSNIDVSKNTKLESLTCSDNNLGNLDLSNNTELTELDCSGTNLTELDLSANLKLNNLSCNNNQLQTIDFSNNSSLWYLECTNNKITSFKCPEVAPLLGMYCSYNQLTNVDFSVFPRLSSLYCDNNLIEKLDVSNNKELRNLDCHQNKLSSLIISDQNTKLYNIYCQRNMLKGAAMDSLINHLSAPWGRLYVIDTLYVDEHNICTKEQVQRAKDKSWTVYGTSGVGYYYYEGSDPVNTDLNPVDGGDKIDIGTEINTDTNLDGNVVGNILYNISSGNGEYNAQEGCLVINKATSDETMSTLEGKDIFGEDVKDNFTGIVLKVAEGSGKVAIEAETTGPMVLKMKVGNEEPLEMEFEGKLKVKFPYNVTEETYVYIYGSTKAAQQAKGMRRANGTDGTLKIFGIEIEKNPTAIDDIFADDKPMDIYTLSGQKVRSGATSLQGLPAGVYIVGGKKVVVSK